MRETPRGIVEAMRREKLVAVGYRGKTARQKNDAAFPSSIMMEF